MRFKEICDFLRFFNESIDFRLSYITLNEFSHILNAIKQNFVIFQPFQPFQRQSHRIFHRIY